MGNRKCGLWLGNVLKRVLGSPDKGRFRPLVYFFEFHSPVGTEDASQLWHSPSNSRFILFKVAALLEATGKSPPGNGHFCRMTNNPCEARGRVLSRAGQFNGPRKQRVRQTSLVCPQSPRCSLCLGLGTNSKWANCSKSVFFWNPKRTLVFRLVST